MTLWQQLIQHPEDRLRRWQRKARVAARRASHEQRAQYVLAQRIYPALLVALVITVGLLASLTTRQWLATAFATVAIVGGILAAPVMSVVAWIGVTLPDHAPLHQAAPTLFIGALLWMAMAFVSAHARRDHSADADR